MAKTILGRKVGMTRVYDEKGNNTPVTIVAAGPCYVSQIKTPETDGYAAVQIAFDEVKPRRSTMQLIGHDHKAGVTPKRFHKEFRITADEAASYQLGQVIDVSVMEGTKFVDVSGVSKGKGFQGTMKRHHFKGLCASHGTERKHRSPGSIAGYGNERGGTGGPKRGKKMAGHMGAANVTCRSLDVVAIDKENNVLLIKGSVPGGKNAFVVIREAGRLWKPKAAIVAAAS